MEGDINIYTNEKKNWFYNNNKLHIGYGIESYLGTKKQ